MKKLMSTLIAVCMLIAMLSGAVLFTSSADAYETAKLVGFSTWTQAELNTSSGNNGYANSCGSALYVETNAAYCVGGTTQAIKAVHGGNTAYNNCIVNWKYGSGGPCTAGNVWAAADGSSVKASDYDGIRIAVLNSKGEPANFTKVTLRIAYAWNYSSNMRYWEGKPTVDANGWLYFPFSEFQAAGTPGGTDIYDYMDNYAKGISMLNYGSADENTCYYSGVEYYRTAGQVNKNTLIAAIAKLTGYDATTYASQIAAAQAVVDDDAATQKQVDAQELIINTCINEFINNRFKDYNYVQLKGVQTWTADDLASLTPYGSNYALSDKGLKGNATQSVEMTVYGNLNRFCLASKTSSGFLAKNPFEFMDTTKGYKLSDFDGIAIAFSDENGKPFELSQFQVRLMRGQADWDSYWTYEGNYYDVPLIYHNGYYHLYFKDYTALSGDAINDISVISALFYRSLKVGDKGYFSDICAFKNGEIEEPEDTEEDIEAAKDTLNGLLNQADELGFFDSTSEYYEEASFADSVYTNAASTMDQYRVQSGIIRRAILAETVDPGNNYDLILKCLNAWKYNYTNKSYNALSAAIDQAWKLIYVDDDEAGAVELLSAAYDKLVPVVVEATTGNFMEGWTDTLVNDVVTANSNGLTDSIGRGLNIKDEWNGGHYSNNTVFEANNNFSLTALADFDNKAMGWKNFDGGANMQPKKDGAYPPMNVEGLSKGDGIRFKLEATGSVGRILIGLSNCADMVREDYAMFIKPEFVADDGYINIPFSYFEKAFWCSEKFNKSNLEQVIVFIIECFDVKEDTVVTVSDLHGYRVLSKATDEQLAKVYNAADKLEAFDIDGRYAKLIADAKALDKDSYDADCTAIYDQVFAVLKSFGDPSAAIVDVPGFSIYSQEELDMMDSLDGESSLTKTERGVIYNLPPKSGDYAFVNGIYVPGTGFEDSHDKDPFYGKTLPINGKTFIDMLGGYKLTDIIAYRYQVADANPNKGNAIHYSNGAGLWHSLLTKKHDVKPDADNWFTYYIDETPIDTNDWYYNDFDLQRVKEETVFAVFEIFDQRGKEMYNWQVILYEAIDRSELKQALADYAGQGVEGYDAAMEVYYNPDATAQDIADAVAALNMGAVAFELSAKWEYNYTAESWTAFRAAADAAQTAEDAEAALALLVPLNVKPTTGNLMDGWTTADVNATVTANSDKLCDSIGEGLNINNAWNAGDFSNNTTFAADSNFSMTATADFTGKAMGWKNMDRSQTLQPNKNGAFPALNVKGLSEAEGIRFKLEVTGGTVERILIGLSNCSKFVREMYAMKIKAAYTLDDGYINIPFSYFEKAFWCDAFAQNELEDVIVFIIEAYGATEGTTVTVSDLRGYKKIAAPTDADFEALTAAVNALKALDLDGTHFADAYALAEEVAAATDQDVVLDATAEINAIVAEFDAVGRTAIKAKLDELIALDVTDYFADDIASFKGRYYGELDAAGAEQLIADIQACIDQFSVPEAPNAPVAIIVETNRVVLSEIEGAEYKCGDGEWQASTEFAGLTANTEYTFYARYVAAGVSSASEVSEGTVVKTLKDKIAGTVVVTGDFRYNTVATAEVELASAAEYTVEWYNVTGKKVGEGATYTFAAEDIGATFFVKVLSADLDGMLQSDAFGPVEKGLVKVTADPTAELLPLGMTLAEAILVGGEADVNGVWAFANPETIPEFDQSGSEFDVVFTPAEADLYELYTCKVVVEINAVTEIKTVVNNDFGTVELTGDFHNLNVTTFEMTKITPAKTAYVDLLRAANRSGTDKNIIFMYSIEFDTAIAPYIGTLTFKAGVGNDRVGETYTVWFFTKDGVVSREGVIDQDGNITVHGLKF